jgi:membrane peptidoglycan carboxypeptidase
VPELYAITLGIYPVVPFDLSTVYATFSSNGVRAERHVVETVSTALDGVVWYSARPTRTKVLEAQVAADVSTVLAEVVDNDGKLPGRPAAGKTGHSTMGQHYGQSGRVDGRLHAPTRGRRLGRPTEPRTDP